MNSLSEAQGPMTSQTNGRHFRVGAFVPQGWKQEHLNRSAADAWEKLVAFSEEASSFGYDDLWVFDHLETYPDRIAAPLFDPWTTLASISAMPRIGLGVLVNCVSHRSVSHLAKQAACVDVMSGGGRLKVGLGAGWDEDEHARHGLRFGPPRERVAVLEETVAALRLLWTNRNVHFDGEHVKLAGATSSPRPVQPPAVVIGGEGERHTLRIAANHADVVNWQTGVEGFVHKSRVLHEHCERAGRDFHAIERTHAPNCLLFDSARDYRRWLARPEADRTAEEQSAYNRDRGAFIGPVEDVAEVVSAYLDAGCSGFQIYFADSPRTDSLARFMAEVVPTVDRPVASIAADGVEA